ncbi:hypothetical protein W97_04694 [Coniosporium apollinis CBS 100218]|uniref:Major facilitator superfamily (MFS) profile domain-containing protein n=1 Tax=Coniosporium apollinis (strain CBS 100218) TaxID=1168221 RepID=R7YUU3_CONA1|nr:uncharacterized protein W97_04694 [Coniosporium apollinis CBS 100218]EON65456.1 hypothetical protein W97_04694 [Coniosporium apollinis CBS 100218]
MSRTSIELVPQVTYPASVALPAPTANTGSTYSIATRQSESNDDDRRTLTEVVSAGRKDLSKGTTAVVITSVTCITGISSLLAGLVTVGLPTIAKDLNIPPALELWPASIYALTCGCTLLLSGAVADVVGCRIMYLIGCVLQSVFTLACGLSKNGTQLIVFRGLAGIAISFCLPSAVSIITNTLPEGRPRNIAFAAMGGGQPIGFSLGLALGGVFADSIGWEWGFHIAAIINSVIFVVALWGLPKNIGEAAAVSWQRLATDVDWMGAALASISLAMFSYVLATLSSSTSNIKVPTNIALLTTAILLVPAFILWVGRQERLNRPALIPNSLWRNRVFTAICIAVFLTWGAFNAVENILTFYFQYVQQISAIQTSLRFLPAPVSGALTNLVMGLVVHRMRADWAVSIATAVSCVAPLVMAVVNPQWSYWTAPFWAVFLNPIGADTLFTISNLLITSVFPSKTQGLAGGVFNTIAQIGKSVGLATSAVVAASVTARMREGGDKVGEGHGGASPESLMVGYRATFWYVFALGIATLAVSIWGLRKIGKVGVKRE